MSNLSHHLGIIISVSVLVVGLSDPAHAQPQNRVKQIIANQITTKATVTTTKSRQPTEAILENIRLKLSTPAKPRKLVIRSTTKPRSAIPSVLQATKIRKPVNVNRSAQGTETFTAPNRSNPRSNKSSGIDRWVD